MTTYGQRKKWFAIRNTTIASGEPVEILIFDSIGSDFYGEGLESDEFATQLKAIPQGREILVRINSPGGNVSDGLAIYHLLRERRSKVRVRIDGRACSIASVIALGGHSLEMPRNAIFMIHDPWTACQGNARDMKKCAKDLEFHSGLLVDIYQQKTGADAKDISQWMADETYYDGREAYEFGFCDVLLNEEIDDSVLARYDRGGGSDFNALNGHGTKSLLGNELDRLDRKYGAFDSIQLQQARDAWTDSDAGMTKFLVQQAIDKLAECARNEFRQDSFVSELEELSQTLSDAESETLLEMFLASWDNAKLPEYSEPESEAA
jgi:ATP-dependent Clp endopeptidase proteolytic subunit ClpP